jgi:N6-L-threonylcarbamoyladenine synthase
MKLKNNILGIETSCDDTGLAVSSWGGDILWETLKSSYKKHSIHGGFVPELASREHESYIASALHELKESEILDTVHLISYTSEPGLPGSLHVGKVFAKTLSTTLNKPLMEINHLHAHIFSCFINKKNLIKFPFLGVVVSGGHTSIFVVYSYTNIKEVLKTTDDAIGEVFDKVGRHLGLNFPGGPEIDRIFDKSLVDLNMFGNYGKLRKQDFLSYSGLKSSVINYVNKNDNIRNHLAAIASSFQAIIIETFVDKVIHLLYTYNLDTVAFGGGVTANSYLRKLLSEQERFKFYYPEKRYCQDNGSMIAFLASCILAKNCSIII